jgi:hypothetical protein
MSLNCAGAPAKSFRILVASSIIVTKSPILNPKLIVAFVIHLLSLYDVRNINIKWFWAAIVCHISRLKWLCLHRHNHSADYQREKIKASFCRQHADIRMQRSSKSFVLVISVEYECPARYTNGTVLNKASRVVGVQPSHFSQRSFDSNVVAESLLEIKLQ